MAEYKTTIEADVFVGKYRTAADAVFGSLRRWEAEHGNKYTNIAIVVEVIEAEPCPKGFMRVNLACKVCGSKIRPKVVAKLPRPSSGEMWVKAGSCKHGAKL